MIFDEDAPGANQQSEISIEMPTSLLHLLDRKNY
jgi:hypothetical protein